MQRILPTLLGVTLVAVAWSVGSVGAVVEDLPSLEVRRAGAGTWFEVRGARQVEAHPAAQKTVPLASLATYGDGARGSMLLLRETGVERGVPARIELAPLPVEPGTYLLTGAAWGETAGRVGVSVVLPRMHEKVALPVAIYSEDVRGVLHLERDPDGSLSGEFLVRARLERDRREPWVEARAVFSGVVVPADPAAGAQSPSPR